MKAVYITEHGGTEALTYGDLPEPEIGPNDVKVRVRACALNRLDVYIRGRALAARAYASRVRMCSVAMWRAMLSRWAAR